MNNIYYAIASYHRPQCKTYHALKECGIEDDRIIISLNDPNDYEAYRQALGDKARIIVNEGMYVFFNRNTCLSQFTDGQRVLLLDDDINKFEKWYDCQGTKYGRLRKLTHDFEIEIEGMFAFMEKNGIKYAGVLPVDNSMTMSKLNKTGEYYSFNTLLQGGFNFIIKDNKIKFENMPLLDDYELCLRLIKKGNIIVRNNTIVPSKPCMGRGEGGYYEIYRSTNLQKQYLQILKKKYKDMVTIRGNNMIIKKKWRL